MISNYISMKEITHEEYRKFIETHDYVIIDDVKVLLPKQHEIKELKPKDYQCVKCGTRYHQKPPQVCNCGGKDFKETEYTLETTTVWSFPERGDWATHRGNYRANWSPYIPRNLILRYTKEDDLVLDQMVGSGTTLVECKLLNRRGIGVDINPDAIMVARNRLDFPYEKEPEIKTYVGDARNLDQIDDESIDLIATHPPYASIVRFSHGRVEGDLSAVGGVAEFVKEMRIVAEECMRVLKPGKHCAILIGDTRKHKHFVPITPRVLKVFLDAGFIIREDVIKLQWKMKSTREKWRGRNYDFLLLAHEHLYIFRKPEGAEKLTHFKDSISI